MSLSLGSWGGIDGKIEIGREGVTLRERESRKDMKMIHK